VLSFFGTPWDKVTAEVVEQFLSEAGDEGLLWEAKGHEQPHRDVVRKAVSGLANAAGGFLIIGAERDQNGRWMLPGVEFQSGEPGTWLSSLITVGVHPTPVFDLKAFDRGQKCVAVVVVVGAVAVPPCITATGVIYQRVVGQTLPVTDQRVLAELYARGRAAREQTEALALRAATRALAEPAAESSDQALLGISICPVESASDKSAVLFRRSFAGRVGEMITTGLQVDPNVIQPVRVETEQDVIRAYPGSYASQNSWTASAYWDGAVSAVFTTPSSELYVSDLAPRINQAWRVLVDLATAAGGRGEAHLVVQVRVEHLAVSARRGIRPRHPIRRWTELREPNEDELGSVRRELLRGFGETALEPETSPAHES
jgi:hypothetical protein